MDKKRNAERKQLVCISYLEVAVSVSTPSGVDRLGLTAVPFLHPGMDAASLPANGTVQSSPPGRTKSTVQGRVRGWVRGRRR